MPAVTVKVEGKCSWGAFSLAEKSRVSPLKVSELQVGDFLYEILFKKSSSVDIFLITSENAFCPGKEFRIDF